MSLKPIDMQTNINQMPEVARKEHAQQDAVHLGIHRLDQEANEKSDLKNSRLDEMNKASEMTNRLDDREGGGEGRQGKKKKGEQPEAPPHKRGIEMVEDANLGRHIDVKK